jgi:hypothetical protein
MIEAGQWLSRKQRRTFHQPRLRRESLGELIQIDGREHRWFEDRAGPCTLLVFIDDATGRLMQLRFVDSESTETYFEALRGYLEMHGCAVAFYSDKHTVFRVAKQDAQRGHGITQFGRALSELNIEILCANSSQAKGRIERVNRTLQDRLVVQWRGCCWCRLTDQFVHVSASRTFLLWAERDISNWLQQPMRAFAYASRSRIPIPQRRLTAAQPRALTHRSSAVVQQAAIRRPSGIR